MSMSKQDVLNHCRSYFLDRFNNHDQKCWSGWGLGDEPSARCALGSLVTGRCYSVMAEAKKILGVNPQDLLDETFYGAIMLFNDTHSHKGNKLTISGIDEFLNGLAAKYDLEYESINEANALLPIGEYHVS